MGEPSKSASTRFGFDVTRHNFEEALPGVVESIEEAQFVAIDTELTGLSSASNFEDMTDEPRERYIKLRKYATDFGILQYGVACFRWDEASKKYLVKPYNFYLSAATHRDTGIERRFMAQASSIEFLAEYKFNFNKAFHDGISYLSHDEEKSVRGRIPALRGTDNGETTPGYSEVTLDEAAKKVVDQSIAAVDAWLIAEPQERTLILPPCNGFHRRVLFQELPKKYGTSIQVSSQEAPGTRHKSMVITRMTDSREVEAIAEAAKREALEQLSKWIGFRKVIDALKGKPVIGHNMFLDLIHTVNKFQAGYVGSLDDWKGAVWGMFGSVFDTKHIASSIPEISNFLATSEGGTALSEVYGAFNTPSLKFEPSIDISFGFGAVGNDTFHDAAFDAYCTGLAFARMAAFAEKHAGKMDVDGAKPDGEAATAEPASAADAPLAAPLDLNGPILKPLANFIHMMRSLTTSVNIGGDDILADLSHIFHLQHVTQPLPTPPPAFDEVRKIIAQEFPDLEGLAASSFIKQAPFEDYAWILTINDRAAAAQFADRFLPKMVEGEEAPTEPPLVGGNWKVTTMREYKDSKFSNRKRANPDEPSMENGNSSQKRKVDE